MGPGQARPGLAGPGRAWPGRGNPFRDGRPTPLTTSILSRATLFGLLVASLATAQIPPPTDGPRKSDDLRRRRDEILAKERTTLREPGDPAGGPADGSSQFVLLPEVVEPFQGREAPPPRGGPDRESTRLETAKDLFDLATRATKPPESFALADQCLRDVVERQPDHAEARRLLGYVPHQGGWATPFAVRMLAEGSVYDTTYGWVKADWVPHLKRGELPDRSLKRWLPAEQADALRRDWATHWEIPTEHFRISTNVSLNEAISFGRKLEDLHQLFFALMADVVDPDRLPLARRSRQAAGKAGSSVARNPYQVYYFASRDEYARFVEPLLGQDAKASLGTYFPRKEAPASYGGISYFFNDAGGQLDVTATLYHEASHQLLFESAGSSDYARNSGQYWVFEGLGTYFETLQHNADGTIRIGGLIGPRIAQAKIRLIGRREFIPIEKFAGLSRSKFLAGDIYLNYAESMALAVFLMQADGGRHREAFLDYTLDAYKGRFRGAAGRSLAEQVGLGFPELNRTFLAYLGHEPGP